MFLLAGALVLSSNKRLGGASLSDCESQYMGLPLAGQEASFWSQLTGEMDGVEREENKKWITLLTESLSPKALAENPVYHSRSKHFEANSDARYVNLCWYIPVPVRRTDACPEVPVLGFAPPPKFTLHYFMLCG